MTKINIRLPEPKEEYDVSNQKQINRALTIMKDQLNVGMAPSSIQNYQEIGVIISHNLFQFNHSAMFFG